MTDMCALQHVYLLAFWAVWSLFSSLHFIRVCLLYFVELNSQLQGQLYISQCPEVVSRP